MTLNNLEIPPADQEKTRHTLEHVPILRGDAAEWASLISEGRNKEDDTPQYKYLDDEGHPQTACFFWQLPPKIIQRMMETVQTNPYTYLRQANPKAKTGKGTKLHETYQLEKVPFDLREASTDRSQQLSELWPTEFRFQKGPYATFEFTAGEEKYDKGSHKTYDEFGDLPFSARVQLSWKNKLDTLTFETVEIKRIYRDHFECLGPRNKPGVAAKWRAAISWYDQEQLALLNEPGLHHQAQGWCPIRGLRAQCMVEQAYQARLQKVVAKAEKLGKNEAESARNYEIANPDLAKKVQELRQASKDRTNKRKGLDHHREILDTASKEASEERTLEGPEPKRRKVDTDT
jgi:hypothetical protein